MIHDSVSRGLAGLCLAAIAQCDCATTRPKTAIVVQGHTDATGTEVHNQDLSERRAHAVVAYLTGKGIDPARTAPVGYGEGQPIGSNTTASGRAQNRRVDLLLKAKAR